MSTDKNTAVPLNNPEKIAQSFLRLGWVGFWIQLVMIAIPILLLFYVLVIASLESIKSKGIDLSAYLSYGSLAVMLFTTFWFFRYTRLARQIMNPDKRPSRKSVIDTVWIGLWASAVGIFFSMILMFSAAGRLLFILLATPQTGVPIAAAGGDPSLTLSAIDGVSLISLLVTLTAELIVLLFSIWLLFKVAGEDDSNQH